MNENFGWHAINVIISLKRKATHKKRHSAIAFYNIDSGIVVNGHQRVILDN